jgi:hypothetical protein
MRSNHGSRVLQCVAFIRSPTSHWLALAPVVAYQYLCGVPLAAVVLIGVVLCETALRIMGLQEWLLV